MFSRIRFGLSLLLIVSDGRRTGPNGFQTDKFRGIRNLRSANPLSFTGGICDKFSTAFSMKRTAYNQTPFVTVKDPSAECWVGWTAVGDRLRKSVTGRTV